MIPGVTRGTCVPQSSYSPPTYTHLTLPTRPTHTVVFLKPLIMRGIKFLGGKLLISLSLSLCFLLYQYHDQYLSADLTAHSWEAEQLKRQARVQNVCSNHGLASPAKIPHHKRWFFASEQHFFMCLNLKVGSSTYFSTTFRQIADMTDFQEEIYADWRMQLAKMFRATPNNMKGIQANNSVSIVVISYIFSVYRHNKNNLVLN